VAFFSIRVHRIRVLPFFDFLSFFSLSVLRESVAYATHSGK
jgi:hypothetical protein